MRTILTQRILKFFNECAREDESKYKEFYNDYNLYFKEGLFRSTDQSEKVLKICLNFKSKFLTGR